MEKKDHSKKNDSHSGSKIAAGMGVAALAAAAAGAIFLYGTEAGKKRRQQMESWGLRMRADVMDRMSKMKDWSEDSYNEVISTVAEKYKNVKNIDAAEITALVTDLKKHWKTIKSHVEGGAKKKPAKKKALKPAAKPSESSS